jgi:hypothetical protein
MTTLQICTASVVLLLGIFTWVYYFRNDVRRWYIERGPRRQLEREAALEREKELTRLRDELAAKYLPPGGLKPPGEGA